MKSVKVDKHTTECDICFQMARRGYGSESKYWDDFFEKREKPIKFRLIYRGKVIKEPKEQYD